MPSATAGGLPYPLPTEMVRDGATAIKNLADMLELRGHGMLVQSALLAASPLSASGDYNWIYPKPFKAGTSPVVVAMCQAGFNEIPANHMLAFIVRDFSTNTFAQMRVRRASDGGNPGAGGGVYLNIVAVGVAP